MTQLFRSLFSLSLSVQMAIATAAGIFIGLFLGEMCSVFAPWASAYIMILKITTIPYLICAVMHGIGRLGSTAAKEILQKGLIFIGIAWTINISMIYLGTFLFPKSSGIPFSTFSSSQPASINFAQLLIPENIFYALSNNVIPAIVVFGILVGIALIHTKEKQGFMVLLESLVDVLTRVTGWISRITPVGTFLIIANQIGTVQFATMQQVSTYLILFILTTLVVVFWIFPRLLETLTSIPATRWVKDLVPILVLAYTTNVVIVTLPFIIELIKKEIEHFYHKDGRIHDQIQGVVSVIFNLPLGSFFIAFYLFFISLFYHLPISFGGQVQLFVTTFFTSLGSLGLGSLINTLGFLLDSLGLPLDAIDLYITTMPFTVGFQSMVSVMEISSLALVTTLACHGLLSFRWHKLGKGIIWTATPVLVLAFLLKLFNPFPPISSPMKSICDVTLTPETSVKVYTISDPIPLPRSGEVFDRISKSKVLRVGYHPDTLPFCFENSFNQISGYDMAFAYELAHDLGCSLELIPINFSTLTEDLNQGLYDIAMSAVSITKDRLEKICFSDPYIDAQVVFVMRKKFRKEFPSLEAVQLKPHVTIAALRGSSYEALARALFPSHPIATIESYEDFAHRYPNAILIRGEPQAIAWSLRYPNFTVVKPATPFYRENLAYAVPSNSERLLCFLNPWLKLKKNSGFTEETYNLWVLGKTDHITPQEPRWSLIRNTLHWVD